MTLPLLLGAVLPLVIEAADTTRRPVVLSDPLVADSVVVVKAARTLTLYHRGEPVRTYRVALGGNPVGDKVREGDQRTPEGLFSIEGRNPKSRFHLGLRVSYPGPAHRERAAQLGVRPGGDIMVHGLPPRFAHLGPAHALDDWTEGCIAVTNAEIEEIWAAVRDGTPIEIRP